MSDNSKKLLKSFILDIIKVFPEYEKRLNKHYSNIFNEDDNCDDILSSFYENIEDIQKEISENDFTVFDTDPIILNNVSFKLIWNSNISIDTKNNIWNNGNKSECMWLEFGVDTDEYSRSVPWLTPVCQDGPVLWRYRPAQK